MNKICQYPLKIELRQKKRIQEIADRGRRSLNQTILMIIDKFLSEVKHE